MKNFLQNLIVSDDNLTIGGMLLVAVIVVAIFGTVIYKASKYKPC